MELDEYPSNLTELLECALDHKVKGDYKSVIYTDDLIVILELAIAYVQQKETN